MSDKAAACFILALIAVPFTLGWKISHGDPGIAVCSVVATFVLFCLWGLWHGRIEDRRRDAQVRLLRQQQWQQEADEREREQQREATLRATGFDHVDTMTGPEFEHYVAALLRGHGYRTALTKMTGDFGVDIVASKENIRTAVQCKRQGNPVGAAAIQQVVAGALMHDCGETMVVCNRTFTRAARELASPSPLRTYRP